jgi:hypothetical protein
MHLTLIFLLLALAFAGCTPSDYRPLSTINPIIGDASWVAAHGVLPDGSESETERIRTHLEYAEQLLRAADVSDLSAEQRQNRNDLLDLLARYHQRGIFPKNTRYNEGRRPCFVDEEGTICAVGYLVEQTLGTEAVTSINERYQYATIREMDLHHLVGWMQQFGVTEQELATIQPTYGTYTCYGHSYAGAGVHLRGFDEPMLSYHAGLVWNRQRNKKWKLPIDFFKASDYQLRYQHWSSNAGMYSLRVGFPRMIKKTRLVYNIGLASGLYTQGSRGGAVIQPGVMLHYGVHLWRKLSLKATLQYGYDVVLSGISAYPVSRHDAGIGLSLNYALQGFTY